MDWTHVLAVFGGVIALPLLRWLWRALVGAAPSDADHLATYALGIARATRKLEARVASGQPLDARQIAPFLDDALAEVAAERGHAETLDARVDELLAEVKGLVLPGATVALVLVAGLALSGCVSSAAKAQIATNHATSKGALRQWPGMTDAQRLMLFSDQAQAFADLDAAINGATQETLTIGGGR